MAALIKAVNWSSVLHYPREGYAFLEASDSPVAKAVVSAVGAFSLNLNNGVQELIMLFPNIPSTASLPPCILNECSNSPSLNPRRNPSLVCSPSTLPIPQSPGIYSLHYSAPHRLHPILSLHSHLTSTSNPLLPSPSPPSPSLPAPQLIPPLLQTPSINSSVHLHLITDPHQPSYALHRHRRPSPSPLDFRRSHTSPTCTTLPNSLGARPSCLAKGPATFGGLQLVPNSSGWHRRSTSHFP